MNMNNEETILDPQYSTESNVKSEKNISSSL